MIGKKQKKQLTVSVGIPAYNEEKNIANVLNDILRQSEESGAIKEIIVFCDGCSDNTANKARLVEDSRIKIIERKERQGKSAGINKICSEFEGDFLALFDADVRLEGAEVIKNLLEALGKENADLAGGSTQPFSPKSFFERAVYSTFFSYDRMRRRINSGRNLFTCNGGCVAMKKKLAKKIMIPHGVRNDDAYLYLTCKKNKYRYEYASKAVVRYNLPKNLKDYLRQAFRSNPESASCHMENFFSGISKKEYERPGFLYAECVIRAFLRDPLPAALIIFIALLCKPFYPLMSKKYKLQWWSAESTK